MAHSPAPWRQNDWAGWIVLICLTPSHATVRRPGAAPFVIGAEEWLALPREMPE
jgi:hypothetical protein